MALYAFDAFWNETEDADGARKTNVGRIVDAYRTHEVNKHYIEGADERLGKIGKVIGGVVGAGGRSRVQEALGKLDENFERQDRTIDVVGFGRGGALALEFANEIREKHDGAVIRFMALWDVVTSFRLPGIEINQEFSNKVPDNVQVCFHAMALDEKRESFAVTRLSDEGTSRGEHARVQEVWFRGLHSDVGGNGDIGLASLSLCWILDHAVKHGLPIDPAELREYRSLQDPDAPFGELPKAGPLKPRPVGSGDSIHRSVMERTVDDRIDLPTDIVVVPGSDAESAGRFEIRTPRFSSDYAGRDADDLMDIEEEAAAFARFLASRRIGPPLSVALFGDWGTGKTFLMNKIAKHVDALMRLGASGTPTAYCRNVVQIEFNAWHYVETNLWASLVDHIFGSLDQWLRTDSKSDERAIEALFSELDAAGEAKRQAEAELRAAKAAEREASQYLFSVRAEYDKALARRQVLTPERFWRAVSESFRQHLASDEGKTLASELSRAEHQLGIKGLRENAQTLRAALEQAHTSTGRLRLVASTILSREGMGRHLLWFLALLILAPLAVGWATSALQHRLVLDDSLQSGIGELGALLAVMGGWFARASRVVSSVADRLERADQTLQGLVAEQTAEDQKSLASAEAEVESLGQRVSLAEGRLAEQQKLVVSVERSIREETVRARLNRFIRERVVSGEYARHLGVVTMIRKDFETLSTMMLDERWEDENRDRLERAGIEIADIKKFERVILYIDDLDRCPPEKVVDVLQAIHLLLAFRLFVVVVGVDARWLARSLKEHYPLLLSENVAIDLDRADRGPEGQRPDDGSAPASSAAELAASSHDYLEKIFQVPYWVSPMDERASKVFVRGLASKDLAPTTESDFQDMHEVDGGTAGDTKDSASSDEVERATSTDGEPGVHDVRSDAAGTPGESPVDVAAAHSNDAHEIDLANPAQMNLTDHEIEFMEALAPHVGRSPRRSKRFVNIYRLIKAGLRAEEFEEFVGEQGDSVDYRVVLAQLAIVTGAPILAPVYFRALFEASQSGEHDLDSFVKKVEAIDLLRSSTNWHCVSGALALLDEPARKTLVFERMHHWARRVMRYSFTTRPV